MTQDPWNKNTHMVPTESTNKRNNRTEEGEWPRWRSRSASSLSDMQMDGEQKREKDPTHVLRGRRCKCWSENETTGSTTERETQEPGVTHHRESEDDREHDESNRGSHPNDT